MPKASIDKKKRYGIFALLNLGVRVDVDNLSDNDSRG